MTLTETQPYEGAVTDTAVAARGTIADLIAKTMEGLGARQIFTLMGAGNLRIVHHLAADYGVSVHHLRHENSAVGAADGHARTTGEVGWCTVTQGPGFTNVLTAMVTADKAGTPLVLVTADSSNLDPRTAPFAGGIQGLDPELLLAPLGIPVVRASAQTVADDVASAFLIARDESRPVVFVVPAGLDTRAAASMDTAGATARAAAHPRDASAAGPSAADIRAAAEVLLSAERPVILAGRGALGDGAAAALERLAALTGAHLATTIKAPGLFQGSPADLGIFGGFSDENAALVIQDSDCLLAVGASVNLFQTRKSVLTAGTRIVQVDIDLSRTSEFERAEVTVVGDAQLVAEALADEVDARLRSSGAAPRPRAVAPPKAAFEDATVPGALDPRVVSERLDELLSVDRTVVIDNGHFGSFPIMHLTHTAPSRFVWLSDFGAIGSALGSAIAAAVAFPSRDTVLFIGDCGFYMTMGDFETAVRERLPLLVVCMNDGAAGSELQHMKDWSVPNGEALFGIVDLAAAAAGMGSQAALVTHLDQLGEALAGWDRAAGPLFLDVHITRAVRSPIYDHV